MKLHILNVLSPRWFDFLSFLPLMMITGFALVYGIEGLKSPKRFSSLLGILLSLITFLLIILLLIGGACC